MDTQETSHDHGFSIVPKENAIRYINRLAYHPQIYTNTNQIVRITEEYKQEIPFYDDQGNLVSTCILAIDGAIKLRPYDDDVIVALFRLMETRGVFDSINLEDVTDINISSFIDKCRRLPCALDEILEILGLSKHDHNRLNIVESLDAQRSITFKFKDMGRDGEINRSMTHGLISRSTFTKDNLAIQGEIIFDDIIISEILKGNHTWIALEEYFKVPRGRYRKFFRYINGIFKKKEEELILLSSLVNDILGIEYSDVYRVKHEFLKMSKFFEQRGLLEYGFSAPKKMRTYELIKTVEGKEYVTLRRGPYFENKKNHPFPKINSVQKVIISQRLSSIGLSPQYEVLYISACNGEIISPIRESNSKHWKQKNLSVNCPNGLVIEILNHDDTIERTIRPMNWELLDEYISFLELFKEVHERGKQSKGKAGVFRSIVENGFWYSKEEFSRLQKLKKLQNQTKATIPGIVNDEKKNAVVSLEKENRDKDQYFKNFILDYKHFGIAADKELTIRAAFRRFAQSDRAYKTWFSEDTTYLILMNNKVWLVFKSALAFDFTKNRWHEAIKNAIFSEYGDKEFEMAILEDFIDISENRLGQNMDALGEEPKVTLADTATSDNSVDPVKNELDHKREDNIQEVSTTKKINLPALEIVFNEVKMIKNEFITYLMIKYKKYPDHDNLRRILNFNKLSSGSEADHVIFENSLPMVQDFLSKL